MLFTVLHFEDIHCSAHLLGLHQVHMQITTHKRTLTPKQSFASFLCLLFAASLCKVQVLLGGFGGQVAVVAAMDMPAALCRWKLADITASRMKGQAHEVVRMQRGFVAMFTQKVLCRCLGLSSRTGHSADVVIWDGEGPQQAKGYFTGHEM